MRKCLTVSFVLLLLLFHTVGIAFAAEEQSAGADIPVVIEGGGTAYMIPGVNCPLPTEVSIHIGNGRTGHFYIEFTEAGKFHYTIKAGFAENGEERPADSIFHLTVTVYMRVDGTLYAVSVINGTHTLNKVDEVRFEKTTESSSHPSESATNPDVPGIPGPPTNPDFPTNPDVPTYPGDLTTPSAPDTPTTPGTTTPEIPGTTAPGTTAPDTTEPSRVLRLFRAPKTGDESHLLRYILIAIASSAGLFGLALVYTMNTNKLVGKE